MAPLNFVSCHSEEKGLKSTKIRVIPTRMILIHSYNLSYVELCEILLKIYLQIGITENNKTTSKNIGILCIILWH